MKKIALLTSGGDAPGMNAAIRAVVRSGIYYGMEVYGIERGYAGLIEDKLVPMEMRSVSNIVQCGGTKLRSARCLEMLTVEGQNNGVKDEVRLEVKGASADGSNTSFLFNAALDYPPNTKIGQDGKFCDDFVDITLASSDKGIYLRSLHVTDLTLYRDETSFKWTNDKCTAISIWPDQKIKEFDYSPTVVETFDGTEYIIDLDMNRK